MVYTLDGNEIKIPTDPDSFAYALAHIRATYGGYRPLFPAANESQDAAGYDFSLMGVKSLASYSDGNLILNVPNRPAWLELSSIAEDFIGVLNAGKNQ